MLGDFNQICDTELDSLSASPKTHKIPLEALNEMLAKFELFDIFRTLHPDEKAFTYSRRGVLNKNGVRAPPIMNRLDYAFTLAEALERVRCVEHRSAAMTDHKMVVVDCSDAAPKSRRLLGLWKHNDLLNKNPEFIQHLREKLGNIIPASKLECSSARGAWEAIKGQIREISRKFSIELMKRERMDKERLEATLATLPREGGRSGEPLAPRGHTTAVKQSAYLCIEVLWALLSFCASDT